MRSGYFVTFEGAEGAGKSTQIRLLADRLLAAGFAARVTREPGGTVVGERVRTILLDRSSIGMTAQTEALLLTAARAQHVAEVILPALRDGSIVLCDRFADSTLAYQGGGRGLSLSELRALQQFAIGDLTPDLRILLDVEASLGLRRRFAAEGTANRLDDENMLFHQRVRDTFLELAAADPQTWAVIDAGRTTDEVAADVQRVVFERLTRDGRDALISGVAAAEG